MTPNRSPRFAELDALVPSKRARRTPDQIARSREEKRLRAIERAGELYLKHVARLERKRIADALHFCRLVEPAREHEAA